MAGMWARLRADLNVRLRRGAWYRITQLGPLQAVLEVRGRSLEVPSAFLQVVDSPPRTWSVVARPSDAVRLPPDWGDRYAVCPSCRRAPPPGPCGTAACWTPSPWSRPLVTRTPPHMPGYSAARPYDVSGRTGRLSVPSPEAWRGGSAPFPPPSLPQSQPVRKPNLAKYRTTCQYLAPDTGGSG